MQWTFRLDTIGKRAFHFRFIVSFVILRNRKFHSGSEICACDAAGKQLYAHVLHSLSFIARTHILKFDA